VNEVPEILGSPDVQGIEIKRGQFLVPSQQPAALEPVPGACGHVRSKEYWEGDVPTYCKKQPAPGFAHCDFHNKSGGVPAVFAAAGIKKKTFNALVHALPPKLGKQLRKTLANPNITSLRNEIAMIDAQIVRLAEDFAAGSSEERVGAIDRASLTALRAHQLGNEQTLDTALRDLRKALEAPVKEIAMTKRWQELATLKGNLAERERKRESAQAGFVRLEALQRFIIGVSMAVAQHISNPIEKERLGLSIKKLLVDNVELPTSPSDGAGYVSE
jgi:hypothetical protein